MFLKTPLGFREIRTSKKIISLFQKLGERLKKGGLKILMYHNKGTALGKVKVTLKTCPNI